VAIGLFVVFKVSYPSPSPPSCSAGFAAAGVIGIVFAPRNTQGRSLKEIQGTDSSRPAVARVRTLFLNGAWLSSPAHDPAHRGGRATCCVPAIAAWRFLPVSATPFELRLLQECHNPGLIRSSHA